jgi:hypothetical protein
MITIPGIPGGLKHTPITLKSIQFKLTIPRISTGSIAKALTEKRIKNIKALRNFHKPDFIFVLESI